MAGHVEVEWHVGEDGVHVIAEFPQVGAALILLRRALASRRWPAATPKEAAAAPPDVNGSFKRSLGREEGGDLGARKDVIR